MKFVEIFEDIFKLPSDYSLVHCVSSDFALGAGIAKTFRMLYPNMPNKCMNHYKLNGMKFPCSVGYVDPDGRIIFNLVTKERYWDKPSYKDIRVTLAKLRTHAESINITKLAMPCIGSDLDRLDWMKVRNIIKEEFDGSDIEIIVCVQNKKIWDRIQEDKNENSQS